DIDAQTRDDLSAPQWSPPPGRNIIVRYLAALLRYRWVVALALMGGVAAAFFARRMVRPAYLAHGSLWVNDTRPSGSGPIQEAELLQSSAWVDLLRSAAVLDPVVMQERLYLFNSAFQDRIFLSFTVREGATVRPGQYRLEVPAGGHSYQLLD